MSKIPNYKIVIIGESNSIKINLTYNYNRYGWQNIYINKIYQR